MGSYILHHISVPSPVSFFVFLAKQKKIKKGKKSFTKAKEYGKLSEHSREEERGFRKRWKKILTKVKKECKIRKSAKERPIREIIEN